MSARVGNISFNGFPFGIVGQKSRQMMKCVEEYITDHYSRIALLQKTYHKFHDQEAQHRNVQMYDVAEQLCGEKIRIEDQISDMNRRAMMLQELKRRFEKILDG